MGAAIRDICPDEACVVRICKACVDVLEHTGGYLVHLAVLIYWGGSDGQHQHDHRTAQYCFIVD